MTVDEARLSAAHTAKGRLQRALLERLRVHERQDRQRTQVAEQLRGMRDR